MLFCFNNDFGSLHSDRDFDRHKRMAFSRAAAAGEASDRLLHLGQGLALTWVLSSVSS